MPISTHAPLVEPVATTLLPVSLAAIDAALLARMLLQPHPQLLIDCRAQPCRRHIGVCYFLSQLLLLRQRGAGVWLSNVDAPLRSQLRQLGLEATFFLIDEAREEGDSQPDDKDVDRQLRSLAATNTQVSK